MLLAASSRLLPLLRWTPRLIMVAVVVLVGTLRNGQEEGPSSWWRLGPSAGLMPFAAVLRCMRYMAFCVLADFLDVSESG